MSLECRLESIDNNADLVTVNKDEKVIYITYQ